MKSAVPHLLIGVVLVTASCDGDRNKRAGGDVALERRRSGVERTRYRDRLRGDLRNYREDVPRLAAMLDDAISSGLLSSDDNVRDAYLSNLSGFDANTLAKLAACDDPQFSPCALAKLIGEKKDAKFVGEFLVALGNNIDVKLICIQNIACDSPLFEPGSINSSLSYLPHLTPSELSCLGGALQGRVREAFRNRGDGSETLNEYVAVLKEPILLQRLLPAALNYMSTDQAAEWLQQVSPEISESVDSMFMRSLKPDTYEVGFEFVNNLLDVGQTKRAQKATEQFLMHAYAGEDPQGALKWVLEQDKGFVTGQMLTTVYVAMYRNNPEYALRMLELAPEDQRKRLADTLKEIRK
jgi:hypothetical protein